jgi:hypothetical protein
MTAPQQQYEHPEIRAVLQAAAQEFQPERTAMINRVAAQRGRRRPWFLLKPVGSAAAVVAISALSVVAVRAADTAPPTPIPAAPATAAPATEAPATAAASTAAASAATPSATAPSAAAPARATPVPASSRTGSAVDQGPTHSAAPSFVSAKGAVAPNSVATWSQSTVTVTSSKPIDTLTLTVTVAATPGLTDAGKWTSAPNGDFTITVGQGTKGLRYAYALRQGRKLAPGTYVFATQFRHGAGRGVTADSYTLTARTGAADTTVSGSFG